MSPVHVKHNRLGEGTLIRKHNGGSLWEVRFSSGHSYRLPFKEFESLATPTPSNGVSDQFRKRRTLEAIRMGIVPVEDVKDLTIGLETEQVSLNRALTRSQEEGGDVMAIIADYGFGKSHFIELAAQNALEKNFIVAVASLDLVEAPPGKAREIYKALVHSIRYPDTDEYGLAPLIRKAVDNPTIIQQFVERKPIEDCPLSAGLVALAECSNQTAYDDIIAWVSGAANNPSTDAKTCLKKPPKLYLNGEVARQYTYLLSAISVLATRLGYSGLAVLIDESEHYSLLRAAQRGKAHSFFKSMIYAAVGENNRRIDISTIPNHTRVDYSVTFADTNNLFFIFASTESENRMPIESWLAPSQQVRLDDRFLKDDILKFAKMVLRYHSVAYDYPPQAERYKVLLEKASTMLSKTLHQHRINLRQLIQLTVTCCDLMFLHQDYESESLLKELGHGLGV